MDQFSSWSGRGHPGWCRGRRWPGWSSPIVRRTTCQVPARPPDGHKQDRAPGYVARSSFVERLALVLAVVGRSRLLVQVAQLGPHQAQSPPLKAPDDLPDEASLNRVRLADDEGRSASASELALIVSPLAHSSMSPSSMGRSSLDLSWLVHQGARLRRDQPGLALLRRASSVETRALGSRPGAPISSARAAPTT